MRCPGCNRPMRKPFELCGSCTTKRAHGEPTPIPLWRCPECWTLSNGFPTNHLARCKKDSLTSYLGMPWNEDVDDDWEKDYLRWRL